MKSSSRIFTHAQIPILRPSTARRSPLTLCQHSSLWKSRWPLSHPGSTHQLAEFFFEEPKFSTLRNTHATTPALALSWMAKCNCNFQPVRLLPRNRPKLNARAIRHCKRCSSPGNKCLSSSSESSNYPQSCLSRDGRVPK